MGWVEELGSGVRKMYKYCPIYVKGALPVIEEGDVFKLTIKYDTGGDEGVNKKNEGVSEGVNGPINELASEPLNGNEIHIISLLKINPGMNREDIAVSLNRGITSVKRYISSLKEKNLIEYRGSRKTGGYYIITDNEKDK